MLLNGSHILSYIMLIVLLAEDGERQPILGRSNLPKDTEPTSGCQSPNLIQYLVRKFHCMG